MAGCGGQEESAGSSEDSGSASEETATFEEKQEGDTFTVGFDQNFPPMGFVGDDGEYTGFDLELAQAVCDLEGWELVKKPINWDSKDMELNSGSIDCIWNGFTMNGREDDYTFSDSYVDNSQVIVVAEDSGIDTLDALAGKVVGVQAASAALELLQSEEEGGQKALADTFGSLNELLITIPHLPSCRQERWMRLRSTSAWQNTRSNPEETDTRSWMRHSIRNNMQSHLKREIRNFAIRSMRICRN